ncbi:hypothetical protein DFH09DRAFT_985721, partial [Mycena vulgaris]
MPLRPTTSQIRFNNILTALDDVVTTFEMVADNLKAPFLEPISNTMRSLLTAVQNIKKNKEDCTRMLEQIHVLLYAVIRLHLGSDTIGQLPPNMLDNLGKFTKTLHKIHTFVEAQQEKSKIQQFFRQVEINTLLKACNTGLAEALEVFKVHTVHALTDVTQMQDYAHKAHQEVLELIASLSDAADSDKGSSIGRVLSSWQNSSNSLSLLPSEPKIFHGREAEVAAIIQSFDHETTRVAILGGGGMGKTSLARTLLHHPDISARYGQNRVFVACDTTSSSVELAALIGAHLGLSPGRDLTRPVVRYFSTSSPSLLVLDNLETIWEPVESRGNVERFLSLLEDIDQMALIITMRGAERPAHIRWTRPFLGPLMPLTQDAAQKTFIDIADEGHTSADIEKLLALTDNMPLAIGLIAHLVDYEGPSSVLNRWETESTSLLSEGHEKESNLDLSISLSLKSPRLESIPHAKDLLRLLSILPDGLSDVDLLQSVIPINNILACKAALLQTSLAYMDDHKQLKVLKPIREYMQQTFSSPAALVGSLLQHFSKLLEVYETFRGTMSGTGITARIQSNFANIQNILLQSLDQ